MKNPLYINQLKRDIARWIDAGIINRSQGDQMIAQAGSGLPIQSFTSIIAVLGVVLLGASAISFVAANFWTFPKLLQIALLFFLMWAAFAAGWWLMDRQRPAFGHAAYLLAAALFGVNIMLIGQIYHINAHWPTGILVWALGALATGMLVPSPIVLGLAFALGTIWTGGESFGFDDKFHWPFLIFWGVTTFFVLRQKSNVGFHLSVLSLIFWMIANSYQVSQFLGWREGELISFFSVFWITFWPLGAILHHRQFNHAGALTNYAIILFFIAFYLLHVVTEGQIGTGVLSWQLVILLLGAVTVGISLYAASLDAFSRLDAAIVITAMIAAIVYPHLYPAAPVFTEWFYRILFMVFCLWAVDRGMRTENQLLINLALLAFGIEILYIYFGKFSSFLDDALFFFIGGVILIAVSVGLERVRRRLVKASQSESSQSETSQ